MAGASGWCLVIWNILKLMNKMVFEEQLFDEENLRRKILFDQ